MADDDDPRSQRFWFGRVDPRPLAAFRILFGLALLWDIAGRVPDLVAFYTDDGFLPRGTQVESWTWSVLDLVSSRAGVGLVFVLGAAATLAFTLGLATRVMTVVVWLFFVSVYHRNLLVSSCAESLTVGLLFWAMFADLGAAFSLDVRLGRRTSTSVPAFGLRLLQAQIAVMYFEAFYFKVRGGWLDGSGLHASLQLVGFQRPAGAWLLEHPVLCEVFGFATLAAELAIPVLAFSPWRIRSSRALAALLCFGVQLGIAVTMRVPLFQTVAFAAGVLYVQSCWFDRAGLRVVLDAKASSSVTRNLLAAALYVQCALAAAAGTFEDRVPRVVHTELEWTGLSVSFKMFGSAGPNASWRVVGQRADGTKVDVLAVAAPGMRAAPGWSGERWYKFTFKPNIPFSSLHSYLCRTYNAERPRVDRLSIERTVRLPHRPGEPVKPTRDEVLYEGPCP